MLNSVHFNTEEEAHGFIRPGCKPAQQQQMGQPASVTGGGTKRPNASERCGLLSLGTNTKKDKPFQAEISNTSTRSNLKTNNVEADGSALNPDSVTRRGSRSVEGHPALTLLHSPVTMVAGNRVVTQSMAVCKSMPSYVTGLRFHYFAFISKIV